MYPSYEGWGGQKVPQFWEFWNGDAWKICISVNNLLHLFAFLLAQYWPISLFNFFQLLLLCHHIWHLWGASYSMLLSPPTLSHMPYYSWDTFVCYNTDGINLGKFIQINIDWIIHSCIESQCTITTPSDFAGEICWILAHKHTEMETIRPPYINFHSILSMDVARFFFL